jgi:hypothetical protein
MEFTLSKEGQSTEYYESKFNDFRAFTMAIAEEEEVLKFYFYSSYRARDSPHQLFIEAVIDRAERTLGLLFKYDREDLFSFWLGHFLTYLREEGVVV